LARDSSRRPSSTKVTIDALASKYTCWPCSPATVTTVLYSHAMPVPNATSTSMLALPLRSDFQPAT
jgi:hypothetical protein